MRKLSSPTERPIIITKGYKNGTVEFERKGLLERIKIRQIKPYHEQP